MNPQNASNPISNSLHNDVSPVKIHTYIHTYINTCIILFMVFSMFLVPNLLATNTATITFPTNNSEDVMLLPTFTIMTTYKFIK